MRVQFLILPILSLVLANVAYAEDIASCSNPTGKVYFPELGLVNKDSAGWRDDKITGGIVKLVKTTKGIFDILFVDSTEQIISSTEDGGSVTKLNEGKNQVSFLVLYPGKTAEIYTFLKNKSGKLEYIHVTSRAGDSVAIAKASILQGACSYIRFEKTKN